MICGIYKNSIFFYGFRLVYLFFWRPVSVFLYTVLILLHHLFLLFCYLLCFRRADRWKEWRLKYSLFLRYLLLIQIRGSGFYGINASGKTSLEKQYCFIDKKEFARISERFAVKAIFKSVFVCV